MSRRSSSSTYGVSFWLTLPIAGLFCAAASVLIGLPILRLRGVYFAMVTLVLTEVARLLGAGAADHQRRQGHGRASRCRARSRLFGLTLVPDFATLSNPRLGLLPRLAVTLMVLCFAGAVPPGPFAHRQAVPVAAAERGAGLLDRRQHRLSARHRLCDLFLLRRHRRRDVRRHLAVDLSVELHRHQFDQLHAELLPRRARLRLRADARHASSSISAGISCSRPANSSC